MGGVIISILLFFHLFLLPEISTSHPLCTNSRAPFTPKTPLVFCPNYNGSVCCDSIEDLRLMKRFQAMNISDPSCASLVKSILCAKCDPFSAELFKIESRRARHVPVLCNSTVSVNSTQSDGAPHDFCAKVWDTCQNVYLLNSPFASSLQGRAGAPINSTYSKLTNLWQSKDVFCEAFGGSSDNGAVCFNGKPVSLINTETQPPNGLCLEKISNGSYLDMVAHPDGSNRVFLANQEGKIWLATVPEDGSGGTLLLNESNPFIDLTDAVHFDTDLGLMAIAFHPNFVRNGRFFVSFNCDKAEWPECSGRCSCNTDVGCDPSKLSSHNGALPCQYHSVIAEFTANGTTSNPSLETMTNPLEVRRIFTMGLPYSSNHAGQILFGPADGYLYFMMGDGKEGGDPYNFAQNKKSLLGKIMRFDIDNIPSAMEIINRSLWGNYSIPRGNPYNDDKELLPEIWALGFRNPWRCSFDSERPSYFLCGDSGQNQYEEVDIVTKGGNYGWRVYEGPLLFNPPESPGGNTSAASINPIFPVMGYDHSAINTNEGSASIIGGYFYRSMTDPCMYGRYLFMDLYGGAVWVGTENPENSGNFSSTRLSFLCAHDSPIQCTSVAEGLLPSLGYVFSLGEDNKKDVFVLTSKGVYRVVRPSRCNYTCSKENVTYIQNPSPGQPSSGTHMRGLQKEILLLFSSFFFFLLCFIL